MKEIEYLDPELSPAMKQFIEIMEEAWKEFDRKLAKDNAAIRDLLSTAK